MKIAKWGNSLAIRLPAALVEALSLKEGDEFDISQAGDNRFAMTRKRTAEEALARLRELGRKIPPDFKFNREEANER
jgi:antitoxin MazE